MSYSEAERYVIKATREGRWAKFPHRVNISAELIRKLMLGLPPSENEAPVPTPCGVRVTNAIIMGRLNLNNGRGMGGTVMPGLVLDFCEIADGIDLSYAQLGKLSIEHAAISDVRAVRAVIEGEFIANDIRPAREGGACFLSLYSARVDGDVQVRRAVLRESPERDLFGAEQYALDLRNSAIDGNVYLRYTDCIGTVHLGLATIDGNFTARAACIVPRNGNTDAVIADGAEIKGAVSLRRPEGEAPFQAQGRVSFIRTHMGALILDGANIVPTDIDKPALDLESATIEGGVYMRAGFCLRGLANLKRATLKADLAASGATFVLGVDGAGLAAAGEVDLSKVITNRSLIDLSDARIGSVLKVGGILAPLDLTRARVETFDDGGDCWLPEQLIMDGFIYQRLEHPRSNRTQKPIWKMRLKWLSRQTKDYRYISKLPYSLVHNFAGSPYLYADANTYRPQPFLHLGRVLSNMGFDDDARQVIRAKQWVEARHKGLVAGTVLRVFGLCFGFGYSSKRALAMLVVYFLIGWSGTTLARGTGWLVYDVQPSAVYSMKKDTKTQGSYNVAVLPTVNRAEPEELPCKDVYAYSYALDLMIPLIDLHVEGKCEIRNSYVGNETFPAWPMAEAVWQGTFHAVGFAAPDAPLFAGQLNREWPAKVAWNIVHTVYAMLGWLVVSLAILTFSGLLRQRERLG